MSDPALTSEFPWLRSDAAPILGDSRPRSINELLRKNKLWIDLYRDWLREYNSSYLDGLDFLTSSKGQVIEYTKRFGQSYSTFYKAAGELKDAARKGPAALARFPWAPSDTAALLGDARPRTFEALVDEGADSSWARVYRAWATANPPFGNADAWLDWVLGQGTAAETWEQALDPTVEAFADEIGRLKDRLRETHGNKAQRIGRQVGEAADWVNTLGERGGLIGVATGRGAGPAQPGVAAPAAAAPAAKPAAGAAKPAAGGPGAGAVQPGAAAVNGNAAGGAVRSQLVLVAPIVSQAAELSRWSGWLAGRFAAVGGTLGAEATNLQGYQQMIDRDSAYLAQQAGAAQARLQAKPEELFTRLGKVRDAVYTLAWDVDLGYQNYYGGWPHTRIGDVEQSLQSAGSAQLCFTASRVLHRLVSDVSGVYDVASALLDNALDLLATEIPDYDGYDSAQTWGTHEVVGARGELAALSQVAVQWAGQPPAEAEDTATTDQAANSVLGMAYADFEQVAGQFQ
jgi:hypothetical protein